MKRNRNEDYFYAKGVLRLSKEFRFFVCKCPKKCPDTLNEEIRRKEFNKYNDLQQHDAKILFIASMVKQVPIKRKRNKCSERRKFSRVYTIAGVEICCDTFVHTFRISPQKVNTALQKVGSDNIPDKRGCRGGHNKIDDVRVQEVVNQINKIPRYKSHFCQNVTDKGFFESHITLRVMYEKYKLEVNNPVCISKYKSIFYKYFNIKRKAMKKDTCNCCYSLHVQMESETNEIHKEALQLEHQNHFKLATDAQTKMKLDMKRSKEVEEFEMITFDLEKTLPLPKIPTNTVFYKRQLWVYNCGVHCGTTGKGYCFVWVEGIAGRGAQEVGSCLKKYIENNVKKGVTELVLWADSCGGQNRNIKPTLMLKAIVENHIILTSVSLRFLIPGHTFLLNGADFSDVEQALKMQQRMYLPEDYINVMRTCRRKNFFVVTLMEISDFVVTIKLTQMGTKLIGWKFEK